MSDSIHLDYYALGISYLFVAIVLIVLKAKKINREKLLFISSLRMTLQLIIAGYVLEYILTTNNPLVTVLVYLVMVSFAVYTVKQRAGKFLSKSGLYVVIIAIFTGSSLSLFILLFLVIKPDPYLEARYVIPITGMLVGNSMTGITLAVKSIFDKAKDNKSLIINSLCLGAKPKDSISFINKEVFDISILPTLNSMISMGIVSLPGMMTGQILSGESPTNAIIYQIIIMLGILSSVTIGVMIITFRSDKLVFDQFDNLRIK
ncbi:MAG: iron export ABC transporter permease subunit FetB [Candidatus Delongbacteria bacterium]|nr:iron export ABC transporter permease subunit FetB [Candidatus Delongbacteria bacterium]MBN2835934.1 iron export ABC transporter permease subunit FetB [Candidatus Delongbacteria bacterium]